MAKKKKAQTNPARGFATTSLPSKPKPEQDAPSTTVPAPEKTKDAHAKEDQPSQNQEQPAQKEPTQLTPEEYAQQLERNDLQQLLESQQAVKARKDAARQISRALTDRRVQRTQAPVLPTRDWLPEELLLHVVDMARQVISQEIKAGDHNTPASNLSDEDLTLKIWALKQSLAELALDKERIEDVLKFILESSSSVNGSGQTWALQESLDWLAANCTDDELPAFDPRSIKSVLSSTAASETGTPNVSRPHSPNSFANSANSSRPLSPAGPEAAPQVDLIEVSDLDSDLEPDEMISKYISVKSHIFSIQPESIQDLKPSKKAKGKKGFPPTPTSPGIEKLQKKLQQIESDVLFDKDEADRRWLGKRNELAQEAATRRRLGIAKPDQTTDPGKPADMANGGIEQLDTMMTATSLGEEILQEAGSEDGEALFGGMFTAPEAAVSPETRSLSSTADAAVTIRDFGKITGMSPRRILEDACRARDSSAKLLFKLISPTTYSSRHSLHIIWSKEQEQFEFSGLPGIDVSSQPKSQLFSMVSVATTNPQQSEFYISTAALFLIFSTSPKEEKTYMRLPPAWRDLWAEFVELKKEESDEIERQNLRKIRNMIREQRDKEEAEGVVLTSGFRKRAEGANIPSHVQSDRPMTPTHFPSAESLQQLFMEKTSSPTYARMLQARLALPIWNFRQAALHAVAENQVVILCGETGCGKSTQLPSYILMNELEQGHHCKIYCTEPRRISAISLAQRVSEELGERRGDVGTSRSLVGYAVRLEAHVSSQTRLVYATVGIVLRMLESSHSLEDITHLIVDEVHERSIDTDFLLIVLKALMVRRPELKVILMSATVDAQRFSNYFDDAPVLNVPGRTFPVQTKYLEDAIELTGHSGPTTGKYEEDDDEVNTDDAKAVMAQLDQAMYSPKTVNTLSQYDDYRIDYELILKLVSEVASRPDYVQYSKAILIFLPGIGEIRQLNDMLVGHPSLGSNWLIYPLHSTIASDEQQQAFQVPPKGWRKIVLATNIAETGITIPDVTCVIDTGKHREMRFDERRQLSRLIQAFISRANAKQRRGRAGRVQEGLCFHLFTKHRHDTLMAEQQTPEMLRLSLQELAMRVKICNLGQIEATLAQALDPPLTKNTRRAIDSLIEVEALNANEELTPLGKQLAALPLDASLGKLCLLASIFGCLDVALTISAILSSKSPFVTPFGARQRADTVRLGFKKGDSDLLTEYAAYAAWRRLCTTTSQSDFAFCKKNFLSQQNLGAIEDLKSQLLTVLVDAGFVRLSPTERTALGQVRYSSSSRNRRFVPVPASVNVENDNEALTTSVIAWAFYPKIMMRDGKGWRNIANNQSISLHPSSVNKRNTSAKFLSYYSIMQSTSKFYNANSTSIAHELPLILLAGDVEFRMISGVILVDGNRLRFKTDSWKMMIVLKILRSKAREIMDWNLKKPARPLTPRLAKWDEILHRVFAREGKRD